MATVPALAGQNIIDPLRFDGVLWRRALAYLLDLLIVALLMLPVGLTLLLGGLISFGFLWAPLPFLWIGLSMVYYALLVGGRKASTWGQRMMGLQMIGIDGQPPIAVQALFQIVLFYVSVGIATPLILLVGLFNAKARLVHDMLTGLAAARRG